MNTATTEGIVISVKAVYREAYSKPTLHQYAFSYHIRIENQGRFAVQLLSRYWLIRESTGQFREVKGDGVIGQQPVINPGEFHEYQSWCPLSTPWGTMEGRYLMLRLHDGSNFMAEVPKFELVCPVMLN